MQHPVGYMQHAVFPDDSVVGWITTATDDRRHAAAVSLLMGSLRCSPRAPRGPLPVTCAASTKPAEHMYNSADVARQEHVQPAYGLQGRLLIAGRI